MVVGWATGLEAQVAALGGGCMRGGGGEIGRRDEGDASVEEKGNG